MIRRCGNDLAGSPVAPVMSISRVIVVHGYSASPSDHWFGWLARTLAPAGIRTLVPALPGSSSPDPVRWVETVVEAIGAPDDQTAVVTHSLGTVTALHALDRFGGDWRLGALIAVSGFADPIPGLPELDGFTRSRPDLRRTAARTGDRVVLLSDDDEIVPPALSIALGAALDAERIVVPGAGHFLAGEGYDTLPQVAERILPPS